MNPYNNIEKRVAEHIWYPFTQMRECETEILPVIEKGEGNYLIDTEGKRYIDGVSSLWTNVHGHRKKELDEALKTQIDKLSHSTMLGLSNIPAIECAEELVKIAPEGLTKVFYSDSGSTSVEIALKIAYQYQQQVGNKEKTKFISFKNAYHGDTIGSVSVGGIDLFHHIYGPMLFDTIKAESPHCYRCPFGQQKQHCNRECETSLEILMAEHSRVTAALIIEPLVQGASGILVHPAGFLKKVEELCRRYNILLICDEVAVGFGKTGTMFASQQEDVKPDIMAVAKGISGGYLPLAATLVKQEIYNAFLGELDEFKTFFHGHTYTGNPLACAVAVANMKLFETESVLENLQPKIEHFSKRLSELKHHPNVGDVRQRGVMVGIELVKDKATKTSYDYKERVGKKVILEARKNGAIIRPLGDVLVLMPPLSITLEELDQLCDITFTAINKVIKNR